MRFRAALHVEYLNRTVPDQELTRISGELYIASSLPRSSWQLLDVQLRMGFGFDGVTQQ
jgi:hypothetical protein